MAHIDPQLVAQITKAVIDALSSSPEGSRSQGAAPIKPPIGVCTGDYSQFTDRPDLTATNEKPTAPATDAGDAAPSTSAAPPISGIITAQQLQSAIANAPDGVAVIAHDARPTPLANDFIREHPAKVRRADAASTGLKRAASLGQPWLWWADGHCPAVAATMAGLGGKAVLSGASRSEAGLVHVLRDLANGIRQQTITGGLLFVRSAARATVLANRNPSLRAIIGTCPEAVEQGISQIGANILIVEYPFISPERLASMATRITHSKPTTSSHVERELSDMHRHG